MISSIFGPHNQQKYARSDSLGNHNSVLQIEKMECVHLLETIAIDIDGVERVVVELCKRTRVESGF